MTSQVSKKIINIGITDIVAITLAYFIPTIAHLTALPLYLVDPMRIIVLSSLLFTKDWKNTLILAATIPVFSSLVSMHPVFPKCLLISVELVCNVLLFVAFSKKVNAGISAFLSIICSKVIYYILKYTCIAGGFLSMSLISTDIWIQLVVAAVISSLFAYRFKRQ